MPDSSPTDSPSSLLPSPSPAASSPPSAASWLTHGVSAAVSLYAAWKVAAVLPSLASTCNWQTLAIACGSLALIAAPASAIPLLKGLLERTKG